MFQGILHCQRIDYSGQHSHVVSSHPVQPLGSFFRPTYDVTATNHQTHFNPGTAEIVYLRGKAVNSFGIYAALLIAHQRFPAQLEEDSLVFWLAHCDCTLRCRVDAMNEDSTAPRSYVF